MQNWYNQIMNYNYIIIKSYMNSCLFDAFSIHPLIFLYQPTNSNISLLIFSRISAHDLSGVKNPENFVSETTEKFLYRV